jgi:hypothetical protein
MTQSTVALLLALVTVPLLPKRLRNLFFVCSPFLGMLFIYAGFKISVPLIVGAFGGISLVERGVVPRERVVLLLILLSVSVLGFVIWSTASSPSGFVERQFLLLAGGLYFLEISRSRYWESMTRAVLSMALAGLGVIGLVQVASIYLGFGWGSVDGLGNAFFPRHELFFFDLPRVNGLSYEPKQFGLLACFLFVLLAVATRREHRRVPVWAMVLTGALVLGTGSKASLLVFCLVVPLMAFRRAWVSAVIGAALLIAVVAQYETVAAIGGSAAIRALTVFDILNAPSLLDLHFGLDKDVPAILALLDEPLLGVVGVGFGMSPELLDEFALIGSQVRSEPNFGTVALLYNFGLLGTLLVLSYGLRRSRLDIREKLALLAFPLILFDVYTMFLVVAAMHRLGDALSEGRTRQDRGVRSRRSRSAKHMGAGEAVRA